MLYLDNHTTFDAWLKQRRRALGLTRKELADRVGCSAITIVKIEAGERRPSRQIAELLADSLDIPPSERETFVEFARVGSRAPRNALPPVPDGELLRLAQRPNNLPAQRTTFIGRREEVTAVVSLLRRPGTRLLTLNGPPGIGKTRLSLQVSAEMLDDFANGVFFVPLAPVSDPDLVPPAIAQALGVRDSGDQPLVDTLKNYLRARQMLLVLDNFEQVTAAAPVVGELLSAASELKIVVTSREVLRLYGEQDFPVPPMSVPRTEEHVNGNWTQYEALQLFSERAGTAQYGFRMSGEEVRLAAQICAHLDGLPLAIELAAVRVRDLPLGEMLAKIGDKLALLAQGPVDLPPRQRTLRGAIGWSYDLLSESERTVFRHLSVFAGGCTLEAAHEAIAGQSGASDSQDADGLRATLISLVAKNLLRLEGSNEAPRYVMLETVRDYAREMLAESGEAVALEGWHVAHYLDLAEKAAPELKGTQQAAWLAKLETEHDNLRAALASALRWGDAETALRFGSALWKFWLGRGYLSEGSRWLSLALSLEYDAGASSSDTLKLARVGAIKGAGNMAFSMDNYEGARVLYEEGLRLSKEVDDKLSMGQLLNNLSLVELTASRYDRVLALCEESLALKREIGDKEGIAATLGNLALMAQDRGNYAWAHSLQEESYNIRLELGDKRSIAIAMNGLGASTLAMGDPAAARPLHEQAMLIAEELGDKFVMALALIDLGEVARYEGRYEEAASYNERAEAIDRELGHAQDLAIVLHNMAQIARHQGDSAKAIALLKESLTMRNESGNKRGIIECLAAIGGVAADEGRYDRAARLFGAADCLAKVTGFRLYPVDHAAYESSMELSRSHLGDAAFSRAWEQGGAMGLEEAIALALDL
ncbi:MAG TPA: tetratricopeptide repeat protein [Chloroflexia bacterium]|jgi:predicted ATPase/transcriptional regulator with XRE-family HTH domain